MKIYLYGFFALFLASCSAHQVHLQTQLAAPKNAGIILELVDAVTIKASNARPTILKPNTKWVEVGSIEHGVVYKTKDQVVIVNSFDVHEAYIVLNESFVVGYYLPIEKTFVESKPVQIKLQKMEKKNEV